MGFWQTAGSPMLFVVIAFFIILLTENARVPVDDPATHLELTMIHEVMVLDHSGPDFGFIEMGLLPQTVFLRIHRFPTDLSRLNWVSRHSIWPCFPLAF
jgi:formate hydrogenlyase subunit 4